MVSYSTKATWLVSKEIAPFGGFYIFSYILVIFSSIFLNLIFAIDYGGFLIGLRRLMQTLWLE